MVYFGDLYHLTGWVEDTLVLARRGNHRRQDHRHAITMTTIIILEAVPLFLIIRTTRPPPPPGGARPSGSFWSSGFESSVGPRVEWLGGLAACFRRGRMLLQAQHAAIHHRLLPRLSFEVIFKLPNRLPLLWCPCCGCGLYVSVLEA